MDSVKFEFDASEVFKSFAKLRSPRSRSRAMVNMKMAIGRAMRSEALRQAKKRFKPGPNPPGLLDSLKSPKTSLIKDKRGNVRVEAGMEPRAPHAHLVEFGHNSSRNGPVEGKFFMREAGEIVAGKALEIAQKSISKTLDRELKKEAKR